MNNKSKYVISFLVIVLLTAFFSATVSAQEKTDNVKLFGEIAGSYEFDIMGSLFVFVFSVEGEDLVGAPEGDIQEVLEQDEEEEMKFTGTSPDGMEFFFTFSRDDEKKITKCSVEVPAMGIEAEGTKIDDGK
ncbi:MAG: hypothetical protein GY863_04565 [bacterium]|nr:hypothetical protein [bacterium]